MASYEKVAVLVEGSLGDSLILIPTIRLVAKRYGGANVHVVSLTDNPELTAEHVLRDTFARSHFMQIPTTPGASAWKRAAAWSAIARELKALGIRHVVYALRPENANSRKRSFLHYCLLRARGDFEFMGFFSGDVMR